MKITKQTTKFLMEELLKNDFENFELLLHRKDGKTEAHKVNIEKEQGFYTIVAKLLPNESTHTVKNNFGTFPSVEQLIKIYLEDLERKNLKRFKINQNEKNIFIELFEK